ncbi:MAG: hypothetical protein ACM3U2_05085 [Deltaproteobacteria bacterium]
MELEEALARVSEIRLQIARSEPFRGYRSATAGFSSLVAVGAAALQPVFIRDPAADLQGYLMLWIAAAIVSVAITAVEMTVRCRRSASPTAARLTWLAVEQFLPCTIVGAVVTFVLALFASESLWMLPGLWGVVFSLGVFASCRLLPRPVIWVAFYYLACGAAALALARGPWAFSPWSMGITFGGGQFFAAVVLYLTLERNHGRQ